MWPAIGAASAYVWPMRRTARHPPTVTVAELPLGPPDGVLPARQAVAPRGLTASHGQGLLVVHTHLPGVQSSTRRSVGCANAAWPTRAHHGYPFVAHLCSASPQV